MNYIWTEVKASYYGSSKHSFVYIDYIYKLSLPTQGVVRKCCTSGSLETCIFLRRQYLDI